MKLPLTPIADLKSDPENKVYKIEARISRLWRFPNNGNSGNDGGVDLILVDDKGDRIQAYIRGGKLIAKFQKELEEGNCCVFMNFKLSQNLGNYRGTNHPFKMFFNWSSHMKLCEQIPNHSLHFNFISFDELLSQAHDERVFVDIIGEMIGMNDLKEITAQNQPCKLLNLQLRSIGGSIIDCVFWEKYAEEIHSYIESFMGGPIVLLCSLMMINVYKGKRTIQSGKSSTKLLLILNLNVITHLDQ